MDVSTIDIHYDRLLEWLVSRKKVPQKWADALRAVRSQVTAAVKELPPIPGVREIAQSGEMTYPKCVEVLKLIQSHAEAEGTAGKNLFGTYTNKALKDWHEIVRAYQSSNLFLVEAARVMTQLTDYDVPELKTSLAACRKQVTEASKRKMDLEKAVRDERVGLAADCANMGVTGPNYEDSVRRLQLRLPAMLYDIQVAIRHPSIQQASSYYGQFTTYIRSLCGGEKLKKSADSATLSTLAAVTAVPLTPFRDPVSAAASVVTSEPPTPDETPGEWDIVVEGSGEGVEVEMDWDISVEDSGQAVSDAVGTSTAFAAVQDALDQLPVQKLTDDILELQAFLTQRVTDSKDAGFGMLEQLSSVPDLVRQADTTKLQGQLAKVNEVVGLLKSPVLHRLIAIHTSERQVTLLASQFTQREKRLDKLQGKLMDLEDKTVEAQKTAARIQPTLQQYMKDIAELKALVQSTISEMYEKRPVHVMGAINTL